MSAIFENRKVFSLSEVNKSIQRTLAERYSTAFWVMAEMNKLNYYTQSGHCFPELVEKQDGKVIALTNGLIWRNDFERINKRFLEVLEEPLRNGIKILFLAVVNYDPVHGITLWIKDIDPSFSLGELEKEKQENIRRLVAEQLFDKNKKLPVALVPQRIAVISVETSKGYSDFSKVLKQNPYGFCFFQYLFPAILQGERSVTSILRQLQNIRKVISHFDIVAIIRGGGGDVGLSSYNNYELAAAIANFPLPVITGIGHSTNETVSEMVSYKNAITPTELADWLIVKFKDFADPVDKAGLFLQNFARQLLQSENKRFASEVKYFRSIVQNNARSHQHKLENMAEQLLYQSRDFFRSKLNDIHSLEKSVALMNPQMVLKRGYSLARQGGKIITSASKINILENLETVFADGTIISRIEKKEK